MNDKPPSPVSATTWRICSPSSQCFRRSTDKQRLDSGWTVKDVLAHIVVRWRNGTSMTVASLVDYSYQGEMHYRGHACELAEVTP